MKSTIVDWSTGDWRLIEDWGLVTGDLLVNGDLLQIGEWGSIGDWRLEIGDWRLVELTSAIANTSAINTHQSQVNPQSPVANHQCVIVDIVPEAEWAGRILASTNTSPNRRTSPDRSSRSSALACTPPVPASKRR